MLVALGTLAAEQSAATTNTNKALHQLFDYATTHPDAVVRFHASDMVLNVHSDASYLSERKARSRSGGLFFMSSSFNPTNGAKVNGAIHVLSAIMKNVLSSAAEAEVAALFENSQEACSRRTTLAELGHPQPPTPIQTDNSIAHGIVNDTVKQKRSKAMDMRFYWLRARISQGQFQVHWAPGITNWADYFTKHHPPSHHIQMRQTYLKPAHIP